MYEENINWFYKPRMGENLSNDSKNQEVIFLKGNCISWPKIKVKHIQIKRRKLKAHIYNIGKYLQ